MRYSTARVVRPLVFAMWIGALAAVMVACGSDKSSEPQAHQTPAIEGGPLDVVSGTGGVSIRARHAPWSGTFGSYLLCMKRPGAATITAIDLKTTVRPESATAWLRTVGAGHDPNADSRYSPFISAYGSPPSFAEPYAHYRPAGTFSRHVEGVRVDKTCTRPPDPSKGFDELVVSMTSGPRGGQVEQAVVRYEADGKTYSRTIRWKMTLCGIDRALRGDCLDQ